ncbi:TetR/AcrR family transcriptional regulator [Kitasatospora azatica]|uniref:TetR/AcrR family transcriptional regulator n=1 Tax=Kitasatospora azatica TaxID=58347 RepID=UPI000569D24C|nr:TetR/AcrR family transcriptional regulator [Kitasatospora azatica]
MTTDLPPGTPAATAPVPAGVLRAPQQQRSREKVDRILQATARLLEEHEYEEIGTKLIAAEAGVSIGVLYRFFPDKHAIVSSLLVSWLDEFTAVTEQVLAGPLPARPGELAELLLAAHVRIRREQPGFRRLWFGGPPHPELREYDEATDRALAASINAVLVRDYGFPDTADFLLRTELAVTMAAQLLNLAFKQHAEGDSRILAEAQLMLDRWLFDEPGTSSSSAAG